MRWREYSRAAVSVFISAVHSTRVAGSISVSGTAKTCTAIGPRVEEALVEQLPERRHDRLPHHVAEGLVVVVARLTAAHLVADARGLGRGGRQVVRGTLLDQPNRREVPLAG